MQERRAPLTVNVRAHYMDRRDQLDARTRSLVQDAGRLSKAGPEVRRRSAGAILATVLIFQACETAAQPIHNAIEAGDLARVRTLVSQGVDLNAKSPMGFPPLVFAAARQQRDIVRYLLERGALVNARDENGYTALHWAPDRKRHGSEIASLLLDKGAEIDARTDLLGETPLHRAVTAEDGAVVALLIERGADPNAMRSEGRAPMHDAAAYGKSEMVRLLAEKGAKVDLATPGGDTPLHLAVANIASVSSSFEVVQILLLKGAKVSARNDLGYTPLHSAMLRSRPEELRRLSIDQWRENEMQILGALLGGGADVNAGSANGTTPLHLAAHRGRSDTVRWLLANGANIDAKDSLGNTPISLAESQKYVEIVALLRRAKLP